ncbi:MAG TPA: ABC transporter permease [Terracidiphilus sp.]|jgi:predicted permease
MDFIRVLMRRCAALFSRRKLDAELDDEFRAHIDLAIEENMRDGMTRRQARTAALLHFGGVTQIKEAYRMRRELPFIEQMGNDLRFGIRQLVKNRAFAITAVLTLALGIGATTAVYSVIHAVLIDPYPYQGASRMVHLHLYDKEPFPDDLALTGPQFVHFQKSSVLDGAIAQDPFSMALTGEDLPEQVQVDRISPNAFQYFSVPALIGREFGASDSSQVAVLSFAYWKSHYAGRSDVAGRTVQLDHESYTIVGVVPQRFGWAGSDIYIPLVYSSDFRRIANVYARIKTGVSNEAAEQALQPMLDAFAKETPQNFPQKFKVHLVRLNDIAVGRFSGVLVILFITVLFLLLLGCVNVAILLLARAGARRPEIAMRKTLGATRLRIVGQLLVEVLLLSVSGGVLGVILACAGVRLVTHYLPQSVFPSEAQIALNIPVLLFSVGVSMLTAVAAGLWPALLASRTQLRQATDAASARLAGNRGVNISHMSLLALQVALTVLLLACSGATLRKLSQLVHADLGYDPHNLVSVSIALRDGAYPHWQRRINYYDQILKTISTNPSVASAAIVEGDLPPSILDSATLSLSGSSSRSDGSVIPQQVSPSYFSTLRIPLLRGRVWSDAEALHANRLVLINSAMQRRYWPNENPIGQTILLNNGVVTTNVWTLAAPGNNGRYEIIGVVGDSPNRGLDEQVAPEVYLPYTMRTFDSFSLVIRTNGDPSNLLHAIKEQVHAIDATQAVGAMTTASYLLERDSLGRERFVACLFTAFALLGLAFAASGLYSILSYLVSQRTREFGVRMALGAKRRHIVGLVTLPAFVAVLIGSAFGLLASYACSRLFAQWTSGDARDPVMLGFVLLLMLAIAFAASLIPACLATSIDPMRALRTE